MRRILAECIGPGIAGIQYRQNMRNVACTIAIEFAQPTDCREKLMISFEVENVDETYQTFLAKGIHFINQPTDMPDWGMRVVHLYDPEENLIEFFSPLNT